MRNRPTNTTRHNTCITDCYEGLVGEFSRASSSLVLGTHNKCNELYFSLLHFYSTLSINKI